MRDVTISRSVGVGGRRRSAVHVGEGGLEGVKLESSEPMMPTRGCQRPGGHGQPDSCVGVLLASGCRSFLVRHIDIYGKDLLTAAAHCVPFAASTAPFFF
jgi:hypothetical protein